MTSAADSVESLDAIFDDQYRIAAAGFTSAQLQVVRRFQFELADRLRVSELHRLDTQSKLQSVQIQLADCLALMADAELKYDAKLVQSIDDSSENDRLLELLSDMQSCREGLLFQLAQAETQLAVSNKTLVQLEQSKAIRLEGAVRKILRYPLRLLSSLIRWSLKRFVFLFKIPVMSKLLFGLMTLFPKGYRHVFVSILFSAGHITRAFILSKSAPSSSKPLVASRLLEVQGSYRLHKNGLEVPQKALVSQYEPAANKLLYVASSSLPYHTTGYTLRTQGVLSSLSDQGWDVHCVTRMGYPLDRPDAKNLNGDRLRIVDGVRYELLSGPDRHGLPSDEYLQQSAKAIEAKAIELKPQLIQAASNYESALPALIAARRLGIPFVYEVRGLWEYTAITKRPHWQGTEGFNLHVYLESLTASHADHVFTLTDALKDELIDRGVARDKISLAPNAIDPAEFLPIARDQALADELGIVAGDKVAGYVGSLVAYEGLEDLIKAFPVLLKSQPSSKLLVVGGGDQLDNLKKLATKLKLSKSVIFTGRVPHSEVEKYFSLMDVIVIPRKPLMVCQLVSPLKPLEAMAMKIPLLVSDVHALKEMVVEGETGLVHKAGDVLSIALQLERLFGDEKLCRYISKNANDEMLKSSTWEKVTTNMADKYRAIGIAAGVSQLPETVFFNSKKKVKS